MHFQDKQRNSGGCDVPGSIHIRVLCLNKYHILPYFVKFSSRAPHSMFEMFLEFDFKVVELGMILRCYFQRGVKALRIAYTGELKLLVMLIQ